ncbi:glycosyltransferase family 2 protein [Bacillus weihaiensis]|uniref:Glycosyl transferase n=1 Tax=Bacillus weihaiensis TaxID=1547283 RepID=A0A1L3MMM3_9BACI|nr:glycosyltransferase family 2 protein [Bacillus weihaiensis]APH03562.1 glycosyl transferase [Bacillus weihaiensis]
MISIIIPTLGNREKELTRLFSSLDKQSYKKFQIIVVSQDNHLKVEEILQEYKFEFEHVQIQKRGLSHARNVGLEYVKGNIVTFSDDDCWYLPDSLETVQRNISEKKSEILCFQMYDPDKEMFLRNYPSEPQNKVTKRNLLTKSSIEIFINLLKVNKSDLRFDTNFGLGAKYPSGEENIFLTDLSKLGYTISYEPITIVYHEKKATSTRLNDITFIGKGPMFRRMYNLPVGLAMTFLFFIRKQNLLDENKKLQLLFKSLRETIKYKNKENRS